MDQLLQIRSRPPQVRPAGLDYGFRLFFFGAALWAVISMLLWVPAYLGRFPAGAFQAFGAPMFWHAHEMVYGYGVAVVAGFLLTAVHNWTGKQTLAGRPLLALFLLWVVARLVPFAGTRAALLIASTADLALLLTVAAVTTRLCLAKGQTANVSLLAIHLGLLGLGKLLFAAGVARADLGMERLGLHLGLYTLVLLVVVMGQRVIPMFIKGGTGGKVEVRNSAVADWLAVPLFGLYAACELWPGWQGLAPWVALPAAIVLGLRLGRWWTPALLTRPLLWVLYAAYAWTVAALALRGLGRWLPLNPFFALHAFSAGTVGMATLGMMARVALGHSGRSVQHPPSGVSIMFVLLLCAVALRVLLPLAWPAGYVRIMMAAQLLWLAAFLVFMGLYTRILFTDIR